VAAAAPEGEDRVEMEGIEEADGASKRKADDDDLTPPLSPPTRDNATPPRTENQARIDDDDTLPQTPSRTKTKPAANETRSSSRRKRRRLDTEEGPRGTGAATPPGAEDPVIDLCSSPDK
jgi:hypothetical protein